MLLSIQSNTEINCTNFQISFKYSTHLTEIYHKILFKDHFNSGFFFDFFFKILLSYCCISELFFFIFRALVKFSSLALHITCGQKWREPTASCHLHAYARCLCREREQSEKIKFRALCCAHMVYRSAHDQMKLLLQQAEFKIHIV